MNTPPLVNSPLTLRTRQLFAEHQFRIFKSTDQLFIVLMIVQWIGGIQLALYVSPHTWIGAASQTHIHVWAAVFLGGLLSLAPIVLAITMPGATVTRHVIAIAQMLWSSLLIHLSGGRLETHFHVFGSLAFIAFYRDWRPLLTATAVTAIDHFARGFLWPQSMYGVVLSDPWRWIEHSAWVVFEDIFLIISCRRSALDGQETCLRQAKLEATNAEIENRIHQRTAELKQTSEQLAMEFAEHKRTQAEREKLYSDLAAASRQAGMAEVATGVLHNVGNILNSVNVSAQLLDSQLKNNRAGSIEQVCQLLESQQGNYGDFFDNDPRGKKLPGFLQCVATAITEDSELYGQELHSLCENIDHIKQIVSMQQSFVCSSSMLEPLRLATLIEDSIKINESSLERHRVTLYREINKVPEITADRHKILQILVNLIKNAKQATVACEHIEPWIKVRLAVGDDGTLVVQVIDNGVGITAENLQKMFRHGFTTKKEGHGFGLHSSALAAKELGGCLMVESDGEGLGATFTLELPPKPINPQLKNKSPQLKNNVATESILTPSIPTQSALSHLTLET